MNAPTLRDSRRLTGPNLLTDAAGAILDVSAGDQECATLVTKWRAHAARILDAVGWSNEKCHARCFPGGASLVITAPIDALYAATEVNEWAWEAVQATLDGNQKPEVETAAERLRETIARERNPSMVALHAAAREHGVAFLSDDDFVSVGMGSGSITWPADAIPTPNLVPWERVHDIPVAIVTGSNGKTTTVRMLAAIAHAAKKVPGFSSTDGIFVGEQRVEDGDYSGPGGARNVLRDRRAEIALLETARGGLLRRGLGVRRADTALVTNVAADHLGEFGVHNVDAIADAKLGVHGAVRHGGSLVVNADDQLLAARAGKLGVRITWLTTHPRAGWFRSHVQDSGDACVLDRDKFVFIRSSRREQVMSVSEVPSALDGAARHNVYNAMGSIAVAAQLGLSLDAIRTGLGTFASGPKENPGRGNVFELGGVRVLVDFAHNPHGMDALVDLAASLPAKRRLIIIGQAGDRDDTSIRELVRAMWRLRPDRILIKEMQKYLRGRTPGEIPTLIKDELDRLGAPATSVTTLRSEMDAVHEALDWAETGDLLLLPVHEARDEVLELLATLKQSGWKPGDHSLR